jgi:hypothetical protein
MRLGALVTAFLVLALACQPARAADAIGYVKVLSGTAVLERDAVRVPVALGSPVNLGDVFETDETGSLGIAFKDNTLVALGPSSRLVVEQYQFQPAESRLGFVARLVEGTLLYLSGEIAKLSPEAVILNTPSATIGVRGTRLLAKVQ